MSEWSADRELELACKVGSIDDFERAIEEGANVNCDGGSPLFVSIMTHNRELITRLVELDADIGMFLSAAKRKKLKTPEQIVDALLEGAPPPVEDDGKELEEEVLQAEED
ncbi:MAG: hypothetical protein AAF585_28910 [Verrucomicrobiota bacterium]